VTRRSRENPPEFCLPPVEFFTKRSPKDEKAFRAPSSGIIPLFFFLCPRFLGIWFFSRPFRIASRSFFSPSTQHFTTIFCPRSFIGSIDLVPLSWLSSPIVFPPFSLEWYSPCSALKIFFTPVHSFWILSRLEVE